MSLLSVLSDKCHSAELVQEQLWADEFEPGRGQKSVSHHDLQQSVTPS